MRETWQGSGWGDTWDIICIHDFVCESLYALRRDFGREQVGIYHVYIKVCVCVCVCVRACACVRTFTCSDVILARK